MLVCSTCTDNIILLLLFTHCRQAPGPPANAFPVSCHQSCGGKAEVFPQNIPHDTSTAHNITPPAGGSPGPRCRYILTLFVEAFSLSPSSYRITIGQDLSEERRGGLLKFGKDQQAPANISSNR